VHQACDFLIDSSPDRKPVQLTQHMCDVITSTGASDESCGGVLDDRLKLRMKPSDIPHSSELQ